MWKDAIAIVLPSTGIQNAPNILKYIKHNVNHDKEFNQNLGSLLINKNPFLVTTTDNYELHQAYILTSDVLKSNDYYIWLDNKTICQAIGMLEELNKHLLAGHIKKIITSTDSSLNIVHEGNTGPFELFKPLLTQPCTNFIEDLVLVYNKTKIKPGSFFSIKVKVEYEEIEEMQIKYVYPFGDTAKYIGTGVYKPKVNEDNTINIKYVPAVIPKEDVHEFLTWLKNKDLLTDEVSVIEEEYFKEMN